MLLLTIANGVFIRALYNGKAYNTRILLMTGTGVCTGVCTGVYVTPLGIAAWM